MALKVAVTGGTGFVGAHVVRKLVERGDTVSALVRSSSNTSNLKGYDVTSVIGDLQDISSLRLAFKDCDLVFHVAADYRLWSRDPRELYKNNVEGTHNVMQAVSDLKTPRVVYTSTVGVLGIPSDGTPGTEDSPVTINDMIGHYKRSKFLAEKVVDSFVNEKQLPVVIVNPSTPVGAMDIKPTPTGKIIVDFLNRKIPAFVDTGLNLMDVQDVAIGHLLAAEKGEIGRRYILGNQNLTLKQILHELAALTDQKAPKYQIPYSLAYLAAAIDTFIEGNILSKDPTIALEGVKMARKKMFFSSDRAISELGLPQSPVSNSLACAVDWFTKNGYIVQH